MNIADDIFLAIIALSLAASALTRGATYLQARHANSLALVVGFCGRIAAEGAVVLRTLPAGADAGAVRQSFIAAGVAEARGEFAPQLKVVGGTDDKVAAIISREIDKVIAAAPSVTVANIAGDVLTSVGSMLPAAGLADAALAAVVDAAGSGGGGGTGSKVLADSSVVQAGEVTPVVLSNANIGTAAFQSGAR